VGADEELSSSATSSSPPDIVSQNKDEMNESADSLFAGRTVSLAGRLGDAFSRPPFVAEPLEALGGCAGAVAVATGNKTRLSLGLGTWLLLLLLIICCEFLVA